MCLTDCLFQAELQRKAKARAASKRYYYERLKKDPIKLAHRKQQMKAASKFYYQRQVERVKYKYDVE